MTPEQELDELRKELLLNERLTELLRSVATREADRLLRDTYTTTAHDALLRLSGAANGIEHFLTLVAPETDRLRKTQ